MITFVGKHPVKQFSTLATDNGIVLCERDTGSFLVLRYKEDLVNLKILLNSIDIKSVPPEKSNER